MSVNSKRLQDSMQSKAGQVATLKRHSCDTLYTVDSSFCCSSAFCLARHCIPHSRFLSPSAYISDSCIFPDPPPTNPFQFGKPHSQIAHYILLSARENINKLWNCFWNVHSVLGEARINQVNQLEKY